MFSIGMALPRQVLERLPAHLLRGAVNMAENAAPQGLALGLGELDRALPDGGLLRGAVVELSVAGGAALATSVGLAACRSAQVEGRRRGGDSPWCAFLDPSGTLHGPAVAEAGVVLERLLVVRPPIEALARASLRVAESHAFAVVVIDTVGVPGCPVHVSLGSWPRIVRRLALAVEGTSACVLLVTDGSQSRPLPLPVAQRIELARPARDELRLRVAKDKYGRISSPRSIAWTRSSPGVVQEVRQAV
jgi:recombination protein RecA